MPWGKGKKTAVPANPIFDKPKKSYEESVGKLMIAVPGFDTVQYDLAACMDAARAEKIKFVSAAKQLAAKLVERQKGINNAQAVHIYYHEPGFKIFTHGQHDVRYKELEKKYRDINEYGVEARKGFEKFLEAQSDPVALSKISSDDIALFRRVANEDTSRYELWQYLGQTSPSDGPVGQRQLGWLDCRDEKEKYWRAQILLDMHSNLSRALWDHLTLGSVV